MAKLDDRLEELESKSRLLESRITELTHHVRYGTAPAELFSVVGSFFVQLAQDMQSGSAPDLRLPVDRAIRTKIKAHPVITLPRPERPAAIAVTIEATAPLGQLYECVAALERAGAGRSGSVIVLDPGIADDVALIPSVVRGLHYIRLAGGTVAEWNEAEQASEGDIVVLLSGRAIVSPDWLEEIAAAFAANPMLGAVGGGVVDADGRFVHGGLILDGSGTFQDCAAERSLSEPDFAAVRPVHALSHRAVAINRMALRDCGGLDAAYGDDLGASILDLCLRLRQSGWTVAFQPFATMTLQPTYAGETWVMPLSGSSRSADLLQARFDLVSPYPPLQAGTAAIVVADDDGSDVLDAVQRSTRAGYLTACFTQKSMAAELERDLQRSGAIVVRCETDDTVGEAIKLANPDIICAPVGQEGSVATWKKAASDIRSGAEPSEVVAGLAALHDAIDRRERQALALR